MASSYTRATGKIEPIANPIIEAHHQSLAMVGVTVEYVLAFAAEDDEGHKAGPALKAHGYPALGLCKINSLLDRVMGRADARILLDGDKWDDLSEEQQKALLDHELSHLAVSRNADGEALFDTHSRPKLKMRLHDFEGGWFADVALRHGENSIEVDQAKQIVKGYAQAFFPFISNIPQLTDATP